jgi:hypothetical protein
MKAAAIRVFLKAIQAKVLMIFPKIHRKNFRNKKVL